MIGRRRGSIRAAVLALVVAAVLPAGPHGAAHLTAASCGGEWEGADTCELILRGTPQTVWATAAAPGAAQVRVVLEIEPGVELLSCEVAGDGEVECEDRLGPEQILNFPANLHVDALCRVEGEGAGEYWCQSGTGT